MGTVAPLTLPRALILLLAVFPPAPAADGASAPPREYQVKAAFLYNFARFVEWPDGTFTAPKGPLTICVFGNDPFGPDLDDFVKGKLAGERELVVRRVRPKAPLGNCQMAFVGTSEKKTQRMLLDSIGAAPVLTISDTAGFANAGGVANLYLEGATVRFEVNVDAAERAHLKISSALLNLARIVHDSGNSK